MKVGNLHDLMSDAADVLDLFDGVATPEQMTSRLERLKKRPADVLEDVDSLRASLTTLRDDVLEMSASFDDEDENEGEGVDDDELDDLLDEDPPESSEETSKDENPQPPSGPEPQKIEP